MGCVENWQGTVVFTCCPGEYFNRYIVLLKESLSYGILQVGMFGDLAPRRPKLQTCVLEATTGAVSGAVSSSSQTPEKLKKTSVSREAILSDMRLIAGEARSVLPPICEVIDTAGYLRALISQPIFHCPAFLAFLEIPDHIDLSNASADRIVNMTATAGVSTDDSGLVTESDHVVNTLVSVTGGGAGGMQESQSVAVDSGASASGSAVLAASKGAMEAAAEDSGKDQKDRWRKVFLNLHKNLKPRELAVRYLYNIYCDIHAKACRCVAVFTKGSLLEKMFLAGW